MDGLLPQPQRAVGRRAERGVALESREGALAAIGKAARRFEFVEDVLDLEPCGVQFQYPLGTIIHCPAVTARCGKAHGYQDCPGPYQRCQARLNGMTTNRKTFAQPSIPDSAWRTRIILVISSFVTSSGNSMTARRPIPKGIS